MDQGNDPRDWLQRRRRRLGASVGGPHVVTRGNLSISVSGNLVSAPSSAKSQCVGLYKRFHLCNTMTCPPGTKDFRTVQCERFNGKLFMGRFYRWEPFLDAPNKCELNCRAVGFRFYATLNKTAVDGTPCRKDAQDWICVSGMCKVRWSGLFSYDATNSPIVRTVPQLEIIA
ncbi:thrombospondin type-1 domain-containing protein 4-like [Ischnura elegans]|uniref:thrombospondin type-1 domain-containing protein 4-like n=1 Tax=Ischnura elegans TaxID=197161 RepID=UPI001ED8B1AA|nr:thrombospondin type-1 domain-containing protein 4-like [Ischnura elegans]